MEKILFINACMRGKEISRTYKLCQIFLKEYTAQREYGFTEVDLNDKPLQNFDGKAVMHRDKLIDSGSLNDDIFLSANLFARADTILVGAPYWDLSFPAILKTYIEHVSVRNITFRATAVGVEGICKAKILIYITTAGGKIGKSDFGSEYFRGLCEFYGIKNFKSISAQALDLETSNPGLIMSEAGKRAAAVAKEIRLSSGEKSPWPLKSSMAI